MFTRSVISSLMLTATLAASPAVAQGPVAIDGLLARAATDRHVRVIVGFTPSTAKAVSTAASPAETIASLRSTQQSILAAAFGSTVSSTESAVTMGAEDPHGVTLMDFVPALAITVTSDELKRLAADPRVTKIEEDHLSKPTLIQSTGLIKMTGATGAWAKGAKGTNWIVAVLDTGVNKNHEFLKVDSTTSKVIAEACYNTKNASTYGSYSRCPGGATASTVNGAGMDCSAYSGCGHGTHVAGIAAGSNSSQSSGEPSKGVAYDARILAINVFSRFDHTHPTQPCGFGATQDCLLSWDSDQMKAMERVYALRLGIGTSPKRKIAAINMSLGGGASTGYCDANSTTYKLLIDKVRRAGIAVIIAAGNEYEISRVAFPGCLSSATTVGATTKSATGEPETISSYSNIGTQVDVLAPGGDFYYPSTLSDKATIYSSYKGSNATYAYLAGTSMAAPHVAGAFAAIRSKNATCAAKTVTEIELAMRSTGLAISDAARGGTYTKRRIDVAKTIAALCP